jgi:YVTN family beta-propeller protein
MSQQKFEDVFPYPKKREVIEEYFTKISKDARKRAEELEIEAEKYKDDDSWIFQKDKLRTFATCYRAQTNNSDRRWIHIVIFGELRRMKVYDRILGELYKRIPGSDSIMCPREPRNVTVLKIAALELVGEIFESKEKDVRNWLMTKYSTNWRMTEYDIKYNTERKKKYSTEYITENNKEVDERPRAYVINQDGHNVLVFNTVTHEVIATINVGQSPSGIAITSGIHPRAIHPQPRKVYVSNRDSNTVSVITTIDKIGRADKPAEPFTIPVEKSPEGVVIKPDRDVIYIFHWDKDRDSRIVTIIDYDYDPNKKCDDTHHCNICEGSHHVSSYSYTDYSKKCGTSHYCNTCYQTHPIRGIIMGVESYPTMIYGIPVGGDSCKVVVVRPRWIYTPTPLSSSSEPFFISGT